MDFVVVVPAWLAVGVSLLLEHEDSYPFPLFGLLVYLVVAAGLYGVMKLEYKLGRPNIARQVGAIPERSEQQRLDARQTREHVRVVIEEEHVVVRIDDWELMDYLDDVFAEDYSIDFDYMTQEQVNGSQGYCPHFPSSVSLERVFQVLNGLSKDEFERIWLLNNAY